MHSPHAPRRTRTPAAACAPYIARPPATAVILLRFAPANTVHHHISCTTNAISHTQTTHRRSTNLPCATLNADICRTKYIVGCSFNFVQTIRNNFYRSSKSNASKYFARQQGVWNILSAIWFLAMPPAEAQWIDTAFRSWWRSRRHSSSSGLGC